MNRLNQTLLILHFLGLALGFSVSFANMVMGGLISAAPPPDKAVLGRFPPMMSRLGIIGLMLLWATGIVLLYTRWDGLASMPWEFHAKLAAVAGLTVTVAYIHRLEGLVRAGKAAAAARIETMGKLTMVLAIGAVVFAVLTFD